MAGFNEKISEFLRGILPSNLRFAYLGSFILGVVIAQISGFIGVLVLILSLYACFLAGGIYATRLANRIGFPEGKAPEAIVSPVEPPFNQRELSETYALSVAAPLFLALLLSTAIG